MRNKSLTRKVRRAYDQDKLSQILTLPESKFGRAFQMETERVTPAYRYKGEPSDYYHFRDNNSPVLAVAHLDTVVRPDRRAPKFRNTERGPMVTSGALDDRLGAYVILSLLPSLGVTCDWLLTVGEESGMSTAEHFTSPKKYDHVIEFDRKGNDVVMYQYEDEDSLDLISEAGAATGWGSFSDIAYLEQLGVKCFNWGVGYDGDYHSEKGYAYLEDTFSMVGKYMRFHDLNSGVRMPHEPEPRYYGSYDPETKVFSYGSEKYGDQEWHDVCGQCFANDSLDYTSGYCEACHSCIDCGEVEDDGCMCYAPRNAYNAEGTSVVVKDYA